MVNRKKSAAITLLFIGIFFNLMGPLYAQTDLVQQNKYPDFSYEFLGKDKFEGFNRKMFALNLKLNKYAIKPIHVAWASVMPKYGMERIQCACTNFEYPRRLVSTLVQKDFKSTKNETLRFLTNSTIGLGGLYDPAKKLLKIEPVDEDMEQALAKCKVKRGSYLTIPILTSTSPRAIAGKILDTALDPTVYLGMPVISLAKFGLFVNKTSYVQTLAKAMGDYADPYDIAKKLYGVSNYIKIENFDRKEVLERELKKIQPEFVNNNEIETATGNTEDKITLQKEENAVNNELKNDEYPVELVGAAASINENVIKAQAAINETVKGATTKYSISEDESLKNENLKADIFLSDYKPQHPVTDSMRTALFELPGVDESIWSDISIWNRSFSKKIKTASLKLYPDRESYKYRYILQKNKTSPVAIIVPSIGEGVQSHHSDIIAKLFFDEGYSVIIQGNNFQWEFAKSMPKDYRPGLPDDDIKYLRKLTGAILSELEQGHKYKFSEKTIIGTSFGAYLSLLLANEESRQNTMNITRYISINPPIEMMYAMEVIDKNTAEWSKDPNDLKNRVALCAAKIMRIANEKAQTNMKIETLPFSPQEAKLITGFIMHQKLSDLIFTLENSKTSKKTEIYNSLNNMDYSDYANKYLIGEKQKNVDDLRYETSLYSIRDYLKNNNNYKIYHSLDDYLVSKNQLKQLKRMTGSKLVLFSNGGHLGFLYRKEFINSLKEEISPKPLEKLSIK